MKSVFAHPVYIGSEEMVTIGEMGKIVMGIAGKGWTIKRIPGPTGVRGPNSDDPLIEEKLGWRLFDRCVRVSKRPT